jgi:hypothetical protein
MLKLYAGLVLLVAAPALAFSGPEHIYVSNLALNVAMKRATNLSTADIDELTKWTNTADHTFGDVVALVDQIKDVGPIFDTPHHQDPTTYNDIDWSHLHTVGGEHLRSLQSKTLNENHFQSLALVSHLVHHRAAVGEARGKHWARALLFEAYALHHIEDFLSPGHVATARSGSADFVSMGLHDKYTDRGLDFRFDGDPRLIEIAQFVVDHYASLGLASFENDDLKIGKPAFEELITAMCDRSLKHFLGDSHLHAQKLQTAFLTVVAALSISEVLQHEGDAFAEYCWQWAGTQSQCKTPPARRGGLLQAAQIVGGTYEDVVRTMQFFTPGEVLFVTLQNAVNPDATGSNSDGPVGKRAVEIETLLVAVSRTSRVPFPPSVLGGYVRTLTRGSSSEAAQLRLLVPIPRTNLQVSVTERMDLEHHTRRATGVFLEAGFGLVFLRFGRQRDRSTTSIGGTQHHSNVYTFGVTAIIPGRTVLHALLH